MEPTASASGYGAEYVDTDPSRLPPRRLFRGRPGLIVLTAVIVEIVLIAAVGNQAVSKSLTNYLNDHKTAADYTRGAINGLLTFQWRFSPASGQPTHVWAAQLVGILALLVLTALFGWAVSRGSVTFGRIWVSIAAVVAAVTPIAVMVGNVIVERDSPGPGQSRLGQAVYGYPSFGPVIVAGLALGIVVGLFAALLAVITRRSVQLPAPAPAADPSVPLNAYGVPTPGYEPPPWQDAPTEYVPVQQQDAPTAYVPVQQQDAPTEYVPRAEHPTEYIPPQREEHPTEVTAVVPIIDSGARSAPQDEPTQPPVPAQTLPEHEPEQPKAAPATQRSTGLEHTQRMAPVDDLEDLEPLDAELPERPEQGHPS